MLQKFEVSRRESLWKIATGLLAASGFWASKNVVDKVDKAASALAKPYIEPFLNEKVVANLGPCADVKAVFADLFLGTREHVVISPAQDNPTVIREANIALADPKEVFTYTTLEAARFFAGVLDQVENRIKRADELMAVNGEGNLITFGSPTSHELVRNALGYMKIEGDNMGLEHIPSDAFSLPFSYELDGRAIAKVDSVYKTCLRQVSGRVVEIPNWGIRKSNGGVLLPEMHNNNLLQDYLLISNLPNVFHKSSYEVGRRLINFGGTHREGTSAIQHLFTDKHILEDLCAKLKLAGGEKGSPLYWQALVLVDCDPKNGSVKLNHVMDLKPIEVHTRALEDLIQKNHKYIQDNKKA